ncbi:P-loop containing nucleoside triphosphate hydrolase protein [Dipodascopsis tothii]|uniref:P-loop containing nucleoside triphosphate hydrolase protein n=1 Tax=Dipodascopsis tothii TaxID=44089 RepID=UPI0034CD21AC
MDSVALSPSKLSPTKLSPAKSPSRLALIDGVPRTPSRHSRPAIRITPLPSRVPQTPKASLYHTNSLTPPVTPHQSLRSRLHVSSVPESLPCRQSEFRELHAVLESAILEETGCCVYVSGTPGTGKTATVREVIRSLLLTNNGFDFVEINGMKVTQPIYAYELLWEAISGQRIIASHALRLLEDEFQRPVLVERPIVVLMDELDQLATKSQDVMYNFFNWPTLPGSKLVVIAVANTMDLPERMLSNKISSRLGLMRIQFPGYTHTQLQQIIEVRLQAANGNIFDRDAIEFASRKVAGVTGDARRALDICRRAVELSEAEVGSPARGLAAAAANGAAALPRVTIAHIRKAIAEATQSPVVRFLQSLTLTCKLALLALIARAHMTGVAENSIDGVHQTLKTHLQGAGRLRAHTALLLGGGVPGQCPRLADRCGARVAGFLRAIAVLVESGVVVQQRGKGSRYQHIRLNISDVDVQTAFRNDDDVAWMIRT